MTTKSDVCIVGASCRLPGASSEAEFRTILDEGRFTVSSVPKDRWRPDLLFHPDPRAPGSAYTFAGGFLNAPYDFDIGVFGMSPREAIQVDPQQRILAEVVWQALEDARIDPLAIAGTETGVYIGVSALDHGNLFAGDPGAIESHFMTGNTLSIVANRISYLFDLKGPSFVVDTACSSSLVAVDRAVADLASGRVETAIVGGVNMLLSPASYVGFSRASMLSPTGACRPFSDMADGYVRSEGAVVFILRRRDAAAPGSIRARIAGSAVNSDGRTSGIALPSLDGQRAVLEMAYHRAGIDPSALAFIEAHGTGTAAGDPIEAIALGQALGVHRNRALPIGSVKSNIGHLEPASGVAGMMKALVALEQRYLPHTLHLDTLNPGIPFADLNLKPAQEQTPFDDAETCCGVSSFGFGGTNAHVILQAEPKSRVRSQKAELKPTALVVSAQNDAALAALAGEYSDRLLEGVSPNKLALAVTQERALMRHRLVVPLSDAQTMADRCADYATGTQSRFVASGAALAGKPVVCFVYNGNGAQWAGMGREAYAHNTTFAATFRDVDAAFSRHHYSSLVELLHTEDLAERLNSAACAQSLMFAIQVSLTRSLGEVGLRPDVVLGHSVGEIAASFTAGILDLDQSVRVLAARASSQERVRGTGGMATLAANRATIANLIVDSGLAELFVATDNGPNSVTVSGRKDSLAAFLRFARKRRIAGRLLDIDYPYHSPMLDDIRGSFLTATGILSPEPPSLAMISTVTGDYVGDERLTSQYWWNNIREEVRCQQAIARAAQDGANLFLEIGPKSILLAAITGSIEAAGLAGRVIPSLTERGSEERDPVNGILELAIANGLTPPWKSTGKAPPVDRSIILPAYPWQRQTYRYVPTTSALDMSGTGARHPLIGARIASGGNEWRTVLDTQRVPYLADHVVGGDTVVPATAIAEMALAVARELWPESPVSLHDFDILQPLLLQPETQREIAVSYSEASSTVEIRSRNRFSDADWIACARGRIRPAEANLIKPPALAGQPIRQENTAEIYANALASGIDYGPSFRLFDSLVRDDEDMIEIALNPPVAGDCGVFDRDQVLHPAILDCAFHGMYDLLGNEESSAKAWLPIRFGQLSVWQDNVPVTQASLFIRKSNNHIKVVSIWLLGPEGDVVARLDDALLKSVLLTQGPEVRSVFHLTQVAAGLPALSDDLLARAVDHLDRSRMPDMPDGLLLLQAHMRASAHEALKEACDKAGIADIHAVIAGVDLDQGWQDYWLMLTQELAAAGMIEDCERETRLLDVAEQPAADVILATFANEHPLSPSDLALCANAAATLSASLRSEPVPSPRTALLALNERQSLRVDRARRTVIDCLAELTLGAPGRTLHAVLSEPAATVLMEDLGPFVATGKIRVSIALANKQACTRYLRGLPRGTLIEAIDCSSLQTASADVAIAFDSNSGPELAGGDLTGLIRPGGLWMMVHLSKDNLALFQTGPSENALLYERGPSDLPPAPDLEEFSTFGSRQNGLMLTIARKAEPGSDTPRRSILCLSHGAPADRRLSAIVPLLEARGMDCVIVGAAVAMAGVHAAADLVYLLQPHTSQTALAETLQAVRRLLMLLKSRDERPRVWIVACSDSVEGDAMTSAIRAFVRVAINEVSEIDLRFVEIAPGTPDQVVGEALASYTRDPGSEREFVVTGDGRKVMRMCEDPPLRQALIEGSGVGLHLPRPGMLETFEWIETDPVVPGPNDIAIEVLATGLNFRDVMLAMGLLNDDVLDEGLAGAVYGLECAGRVSAVGNAVTLHQPGDLVTGFGMNSFARSVVGPENCFVSLPDSFNPEAAACLPVAFCTAWYALTELAHLAAGETVLIHGGAGGVGLAAVQIASAVGAKVIVTVSSQDKEAVARLYGAHHVYNSRSLAFVEQIQSEHGGVDVVLNSLAGDAMRGSIKCLKPRGRFVELGKRDYVENSPIGLRPFRRNLSYFGVDLDQLLALAPDTIMRGLAEIMAGFENGTYMPLPVSVFPADRIGDAFRMMQSASHIGKIAVRAPCGVSRSSLAAPAFQPVEGVHLVIGGTRGFGLATALWLAKSGARQIVVASRSGVVDPRRSAAIEAVREAGCIFLAEQVDVTDKRALTALVERINARLGPIVGVYHTAVTLADATIENLTDAELSSVLAPKTQGAENLHKATLGQPLEQFVLYSSISASVGNPGQSAYAAANGYLEGLARRRRRDGLPALAVAWGAIADVGLLADRADTRESLTRISGITAMNADEALKHLGKLLAVADRLHDPVVICGEFGAKGAIGSLPLIVSPTFSLLTRDSAASTSSSGLSLRDAIADASETDALRIVTQMLIEEVAQILRLDPAELDEEASIDGLGMDSLMAIELRMMIESRHQIELPIMAVSAAGTIRELAHRILQTLRTGTGSGDADQPMLTNTESYLIAMHGGNETAGDIATPPPDRGFNTAFRDGDGS